jgi:hypothetical protein
MYSSSFPIVQRLVPLYGKGYDIVKDDLCYHLVGHALLGIRENPTTPLQSSLHNPISIGGTYEDTNVPVLFVMSSGSGKQELIEFSRRSCAEKVRFSVATTVFHEQLVGGAFWDELKKAFVFVRGYMDDDHVVFDEVNPYLTGRDRDSVLFRSYLKQGLNAYGRNPVQKRLTGMAYDERLVYYPRFSPLFFAQPTRVPYELITAGFLRRPLIAYLAPTLEEKLEAFSESFKNPAQDTGELWKRWLSHLANLRHAAPYIRWHLSLEFLEFIQQNVRNTVLTAYEQHHELREFITIMLYPLKWRLAKFACIRAADRYFWSSPFIIYPTTGKEPTVSIEPTIEDCKLALQDLERSWAQTLTYVKQHVMRSFSSSRSPGADVRNAIVRRLCKGKAYSVETGIQVRDLLESVALEYGLAPSGVRPYYLQLTNNGVAIYKQTGRNKTSVYLADSSICDKLA